MKINEKNLCLFATSPPVDLEGWLNKRGEINKSWQRRWFVLKGNLLFYFERKGDREPLGMIILEGCTVELAEEGEQYCFQVIFHGPNNRTYYLSTESQVNMEQWMKALTCAGYDYMKLMVAELQRQLDEIEGCKEKTPEATPLPAPKAPPRRQNPFNKSTAVPLEYASNSAADSTRGNVAPGAPAFPLVSPQVIRRAPAPPVQNNSFSSSALVQPQLTSTDRGAVHQPEPSPQGSEAKPSNNVLNVDLLAIAGEPLELTFARMHTTLGAPVQADLRERKIAMEKSEPSLIMF
ncbi:sesquipedalian-1 [Sabethes cyaneus]|uniref:sesquipedalian-1 n=1 Tax=Sabethes cyaneus TaxID=53552 RepID=UPI00237E99B7|nr:sesquipedalian-1 [Sabethes cyaneus]XP_053691815.1 sesquipedalian-1 [Sabethes cyaneus]